MKRVIKNFVVGMMMVVGMSSYASPSLVNNIPDGGSKYGKDSAKCVTNLSLYSDYYKQWRASGYKNNDLATTSYQYWRYCFLNCPIAR